MRNARFYHTPALVRLLAVCVVWSALTPVPGLAGPSPAGASGADGAVLVVETRPAAPVEKGIAELTRALEAKGLRVVRQTALTAGSLLAEWWN